MSQTENCSLEESILEQEAAAFVGLPDEMAARFEVFPNSSPASLQVRELALEKLDFGKTFGDHMAVMDWSEADGWHNRRIEAFKPFSLSPAACVLHYGQEIFEGLKAFRWDDGSVWSFRPQFNGVRFNHSARRLAMPEVELADFLGSIVALVRADDQWVPSTENSSLYVRPFMIADEEFLGVRPAVHYKYAVISTPVGPYFKGGLKPVAIWVTDEYHRAAPGGMGDAKTGGNYAASLLPQRLAAAKGYEQVCYLDATGKRNIEELGGMNLFAVKRDGTVVTPQLTGTILEGGTRGAIIRLLQDAGRQVVSATINLDQMLQQIDSGEIVEMFACGTAAILTPIGRFGGEDFEVELPDAETCSELYQQIYAIQHGHTKDPYNWMIKLSK